MSRTSVSIRFDPVGPSSSISAAGRSEWSQDPRPQRVVDVVVDVGDAVDQLHDPPLQRRRLARPGVVEDAVADLLGEVEALAVALQHVDHPQRVDVVLELAVAALAQRRVERLLAGVAEGRVAEVVAEPDRLGQVLVEAERAGDRAGDPAGLQRVGEAGPVVVALGGDEDLRLVLEAAEGLRVDDPVAVALEGGADAGCRAPRRGGAQGRTGSPDRRGTRPPRRGLALPAVGCGLPSDRSYAAARSRTCAWCSSVSPTARSTWRSSRSSASGASASGLASASTMKRCASSESPKEPGLAARADDPAGGAGEAGEVLGLAAARAGGQLRGEAGGQGELEPEGERRLEAGGPRQGGVVEHRQVAAEQVVGGRVGLGRVEQPQHRVAGAGAGGQRRAGGAQPRVARRRWRRW